MQMKIQAEIHFYTEDQMSVLLDVPSEKRREFYEGLLFTLYVFRNWYNLGNHASVEGLLTLLAGAGDDINSFIDYYQKNTIKVNDYAGQKADKGFAVILNYDDTANKPIHFDFDTWGFGWLGTGLGYYSPRSVGTLLQYLLEKSSQRPLYFFGPRYYELLCYSIATTISAFKPSPTLFNRISLQIASDAYAYTFEGKNNSQEENDHVSF